MLVCQTLKFLFIITLINSRGLVAQAYDNWLLTLRHSLRFKWFELCVVCIHVLSLWYICVLTFYVVHYDIPYMSPMQYAKYDGMVQSVT